MANQKKATCYYNDGCVRTRETVYLSTKLHSVNADEHDFSRLNYYKDGNWNYYDVEWNVISVCYFSTDDSLWALSEQGDLLFTSKSGFQRERIAGAGTYEGIGAVKQIRQIGHHLYVCGDQGQVYRRNGTGWHHIDDGLLDTKISVTALNLNSIDGTNEDDLYVVGFHGRIYHFNGKRWTRLDSPTNSHLERIRVVSADEVYICGKAGVLLKGNKNGFQDISATDMKDHFWGLEYFQGKVYLAALDALFVYDGGNIIPLKTGLKKSIGGYRLDARDGVLWSFGVDDLAVFDGIKWSKIRDPDNA